MLATKASDGGLSAIQLKFNAYIYIYNIYIHSVTMCNGEVCRIVQANVRICAVLAGFEGARQSEQTVDQDMIAG